MFWTLPNRGALISICAPRTVNLLLQMCVDAVEMAPRQPELRN